MPIKKNVSIAPKKAAVVKTATNKTVTVKKAVVNSPPLGRRAEKNEATRKRLLEATIRLVGDFGHTGATIRNITSHAKIAHGTFYNYFSSQQDVFDQILPYLGDRLLAYLDERFQHDADFIQRQDLFLVAFADFIRETPAFYRVMTEAEVFSPTSYRVYMANMVEWFVKHFADDPRSTDFGQVNRQQLEVVALMVMASSEYINMRFGDWMGDVTRMPTWVAKTFHEFVRGGIANVNGTLETPAAISADSSAPGRQALQAVDSAEASLASEAAASANAAATVDEAAAGRSSFVKFTPHKMSGDLPIDYSAQSIQIDCRLHYVATGHAVIELDIDRRTLNSRGVVSGGTLSVVIEVAAGAVIAGNRAEQISGETISLNCTMIRPAMEGVLVAEAKMENAGRNIRFVTVRITLDGLEGPLIATGTATMRVIE
ncbi:MAG TPA: hotdog domain-containing protein [Candidimonas sp.]|nr:hotdog domain-containing protein [Candidimonas sp.]